MDAQRCPYDGQTVEAVQLVDGWTVYQPCGHPAPAPRPTLRELAGWDQA